MSAEICRTLVLAFLIVFFDCLVLFYFFYVLGAMFSEMGNSKKCTTAMIVVFALSLVSALNFRIFHFILK